MASRYELNEGKIARRVKQGRGQGHGPTYKPWITIQDLSSKGRVARMCSTTAGRQHDFLSDLEYALGLQCDWELEVVDMREQFPLSRADTLAIAEFAGIAHPRVKDAVVVMTTDLLLDLEIDGARSQLAVAVKYAKELEDPAVLEKLEIERRYWSGRDVPIPWILMTEHEIVKARTDLYRRLRQSRDLDGCRALDGDRWERRAAVVEGELRAACLDRSSTLADFCGRLDRAHGWVRGDALSLIWHLAGCRRVLFDIGRGLDPRGATAQLSIPCSSASPLARVA